MKNSGNSNKGPLSIDDFSEHFKEVYILKIAILVKILLSSLLMKV